MDLSGLEALRDGLAGACADAVVEICESVRANSAALCPVQSGALRQSIALDVRQGEGGAAGTIAAGAPYATAVELGTYKQPAKPYLHPAFLAGAERLAETIGARLRELL